MRDVRKMQSNNQFGYSWDRIIVEKWDRIIVEGDAKICIDSLVAISSKGKQVHRSISTLIRNSLEISKNFLSYKFCWISRDCNGAAHASVKLAGSLLEGPFLVISITPVLVMLIFAGSIVLILILVEKATSHNPTSLFYSNIKFTVAPVLYARVP